METTIQPISGVTPVPVAAKKPANFQPWAMKWPMGMRDEVLQELADFSPKNADPVQLDIAKRTAKELIAALPETYRGCELVIELPSRGIGVHLMVQVTPGLPAKT